MATRWGNRGITGLCSSHLAIATHFASNVIVGATRSLRSPWFSLFFSCGLSIVIVTGLLGYRGHAAAIADPYWIERFSFEGITADES